jgi:hypothetical protein
MKKSMYTSQACTETCAKNTHPEKNWDFFILGFFLTANSFPEKGALRVGVALFSHRYSLAKKISTLEV